MTTAATVRTCSHCGLVDRFQETKGPQSIECICFCGAVQYFDSKGQPFGQEGSMTEQEQRYSISPVSKRKLNTVTIRVYWVDRDVKRGNIQWLDQPAHLLDWQVNYTVSRSQNKLDLRVLIHSIRPLNPVPALTVRSLPALCQMLREKLVAQFPPGYYVPAISPNLVTLEQP
mgnify:CR=1 FL=1